MSQVTVIAIRSFEHEGRSIHRGEAVSLEAIQAAVYAQQRLVTLDRGARATYQTTDMRPAVTVQHVTPDAVIPEHRRGRRGRRHSKHA